MIFNNTDDDEKEDYFENTPAPKPKVPKEPPIPPSDPRYWKREEDEWGHLRVNTSMRTRIIVLSVAAVILIACIWIGCVWVFGKSTEQSVIYGYVDNVEVRGSTFKTYEAVVIPYKEIHDTTRVYKEDFTLSLPDAQGRILQSYRDSGKPVKITYSTYRSAMPWRGENVRVAEKIDTVDVRTILPPEFDSNPRR